MPSLLDGTLPEVLVLVLEDLAHDDHIKKYEYRDILRRLRALSLTSKTLYHVAVPYLYPNVDLEADMRPSTQWNDEPYICCKKLATTLCLRSDLANHVHA